MQLEAKSRREFLEKSTRVASLFISVPLVSSKSNSQLPWIVQTAQASDHLSESKKDLSLSPSLFVGLKESGAVVITCHRSEMGQHIRTSVAQIIADEMEADWKMVQVEQALGDPKYGSQNTDGSRSIRRNFTRLRQAGALMRSLLTHAAAKEWNVPASECFANAHHVEHKKSKRRTTYGRLAQAASKLPVPKLESLKLKTPSEWKFIGKEVKSLDFDAMLTGKASYGYDFELPDLHVAVVERPPVLFGTVQTLDDAESKKVEGVVSVVQLPALKPPAGFSALGGVAVIAKNTWAALQGRKLLKTTWNHGSNKSYQSASFTQNLLKVARTPGVVVRSRGELSKALQASNKQQTIAAEYTVPHLSQAPMEPPAATARVRKDRAEIWASTQNPQSTRTQVAKALGLKEENVKVNVTFLGGGFGRKSKPDFSVEAALLSKKLGKPVKVLWTREDDIKNGYYHSVSAQRIEATFDPQNKGKVTTWLHRTVFPPIASTFDSSQEQPSDGELGLGFVDNPFDVPHMQLEKGPAKGHVRIGWLRSVANIYHAFAAQSFAHELAVASKQAPKDYLLALNGPKRTLNLDKEGAKYENYGDSLDTYPIDTGRLSHVVERVAKMAGWDSRKKEGRSLGIAVHRSFLSYVATVVEVKVAKEGAWTLPNVYVAIDAGTVVNTDQVKGQCEGGSIYALSCAIGKITAKDGVIEQSNFDDYLVARMPQAPENIEVEIVESAEPPAGVGEPQTPPFIPALCNALFEATGKRIRDLPVPQRVT